LAITHILNILIQVFINPRSISMPTPEAPAAEFAGPQVEPMTIGFVGLGKMGSRMSAKLVIDGHEVYGWDNSPEAREAAVGLGIRVPDSLEDTVDALGEKGSRIVWHMLPAKVAEVGLRSTSRLLAPGDIAIDGGNIKAEQSVAQAEWLGQLGLRYLGIGTSGGVLAFKNGYPLMVGGDPSAYEEVTPILDSLAKPNGGHDLLGGPGAGHFAKTVHNGVEYAEMQAIAEGVGLLKAAGMDIVKVAELYQKGTLVSGFMMDVTAAVLAADRELSEFDGEIGSASGEALWTVEAAARLGVPVELIQGAIDFRRRSGSDPAVRGSFAARVIAAQRQYFGGHDQSQQYIS
jgi:6-phosphogluconate dehydrogenase